jgi:hypothetical protein
MYHRHTQRRLQLLSLGSLIFLTQCHTEANQEQAASQEAADDVEVTSFNIEREDSPALADWIAFEDSKERIYAPPGWKFYITSQRELVIIPLDSKDSTERIGFSRFDRDSKLLDYDTLALKMTEAAFKGFRIQKADTLKKLVFQRDFSYERNTTLLRNNLTYKG